MGEIAAASSEQSGGIDQVARAVAQMDEATQQNAALVEEAAAAAQSLEDQAQKLRTAVAVFDVEEGAAAAVSGGVPRGKTAASAVPAAAHKSVVSGAVQQRAARRSVPKAAAQRPVPASAQSAVHHESRSAQSMPVASGAAAQTAGASAAEQDWETF
jgi:methyl-accepting chemotaxis protein I, serine sensor receptor